MDRVGDSSLQAGEGVGVCLLASFAHLMASFMASDGPSDASDGDFTASNGHPFYPSWEFFSFNKQRGYNDLPKESNKDEPREKC